MDQLALSPAANRSQGVVSEWKNEQRRPATTDVWSIAEALGSRIEDLVGPPRTPDELRYYNAHLKRI